MPDDVRTSGADRYAIPLTEHGRRVIERTTRIRTKHARQAIPCTLEIRSLRPRVSRDDGQVIADACRDLFTRRHEVADVDQSFAALGLVDARPSTNTGWRFAKVVALVAM